jgi:hypothetical protein
MSADYLRKKIKARRTDAPHSQNEPKSEQRTRAATASQAPTTSDKHPHKAALTSNSDHSSGVNHSSLPSLTIAPFPSPSAPSQALATACLVEVKRERVCSAAATRAPNQKAPRLYSPLFLPRFCLIASPRHRWRALMLTARKAGDRRRRERRRRGGRPQFSASASPYLPAAAQLRRAGLGGDNDRRKREHDESGRQAAFLEAHGLGCRIRCGHGLVYQEIRMDLLRTTAGRSPR